MAKWSTGIPLKGAAGAPGTQLRYGTGSPGSTNPAIQNDGDAYLDLATGNLYATRSNGIWPSSPSTNIIGATGPASIVAVTAPPGPNVGVVGGYAIQSQNTGGVVLLYGPKQSNGWTQTTDAQGNTTPASLQLTGVAGAKGADGASGLSVLFGSGPPDPTLGVVGQPGYIDYTNLKLYSAKTASGWPSTTTPLYAPQILVTSGVPSAATGNINDIAIDSLQGFVYGPKTSSGWSSTPLVSTVGPAGPRGNTGAAAVLPNDYQANSFVVIPVSGDSNAVQIAIQSASGTTLWKADGSGNQTVVNLTATGPSTLAAVSATNVSASGTLSAAGPSTLAAVSATNVSASGTLSATGQSTLGAVSASSVTTSGTETAKNFTITSGGALTFGDGTTMTTAASGTGGTGSSSGTGLTLDTIYLGVHQASSGNYPTAYTAANGYFVNTQFSTASGTTVSGSAYVSPYAGTISSIQIFAVSGTNSNTISVNLYKNGVATTLTASLSSSSGGGFYATPTSTISVAAGDLLQLFVKSTASNTSNSLIGWCTVQPTATAVAAVAGMRNSTFYMGAYVASVSSGTAGPIPTTDQYFCTAIPVGNAASPFDIQTTYIPLNRAGTVTDVSAFVFGSTGSAKKYYLTVYKNLNATSTVLSGSMTTYGTLSSGTSGTLASPGLSFVAGDYLSMAIKGDSGNTGQRVMAYITVTYT